jgi:hypothetical protein
MLAHPNTLAKYNSRVEANVFEAIVCDEFGRPITWSSV